MHTNKDFVKLESQKSFITSKYLNDLITAKKYFHIFKNYVCLNKKTVLVYQTHPIELDSHFK